MRTSLVCFGIDTFPVCFGTANVFCLLDTLNSFGHDVATHIDLVEPHSAAAGQPQMRNGTSLPPQATSMQMRPGSHQYQSARNPATDLPTYTNALQFQQYPAMMLPQQLQDPNGASVLPTSQSIGLPPAGLPSPLDMQYLPCLGAMPQSASGGPVQTIHRNPQIHNTRPQTGTVPSRYGMAMHIGSNNGLSIPPPLIQPSSLDVSSRPHMFQPQSLCNAVSI